MGTFQLDFVMSVDELPQFQIRPTLYDSVFEAACREWNRREDESLAALDSRLELLADYGKAVQS